MLSLYRVLLTLALPLILLRLLWRSLYSPAYRHRIGERFGRLPFSPDPDRPCLWIHAVSVGEVAAALPLVEALETQRPEYQLLITTMTPTGSNRVLEQFGDRVLHSYAPYDHPWLLGRFLRRVKPRALVIMETELWPNLIHACAARGVGIMLANGRLSAKSAQGYRRFAKTTSAMLARIDCIAAQSDADAERLRSLGASGKRVHITGSLKFNAAVKESAPLGAPFREIAGGGRPVWIAASTREGEEPKVFDAHRRLLESQPNALLIVVPRHPERFAAVSDMALHQALRLQRRSALGNVDSGTQVILGDSMGEMVSYYRSAQVAFVGGSLVATGCQNVVEPASLGLPVLIGPSRYNFAAICGALEVAGALRAVADSEALARELATLLESPSRREQMGTAARELVFNNQQALPRHLELLSRLLDTAEGSAQTV